MSESPAVRRMALFIPSLHGGGAERVMVALATGLAHRGLAVDLVLVRAEGPYLTDVPAEVRIVDLDASRVLFSLPCLIRYLREERPDVLLSTLSHANIVVLWARRFSRIPVRLVVREANVVFQSAHAARTLKEKVMPWLVSRFYNWADVVVAVSKEVATDLQQLGVEGHKIQVIYNPTVTPDLFAKAEEPLEHPWFTPGGPPVIVGVGRLTKQKDFASLIRAFALVRRQHPARLIILGEGEERASLEALARQLGVAEDTELPGFVSNPFKHMKRAKVFVLSSRWEGLPNVLIQALALGVPVVATECSSGPREILEDGRFGTLVPVGDERTMAEAILKSLLEPTPQIHPEALTRFSLDTVVAQYEDVLLGQLSGVGSAPLNRNHLGG